MSQPTDNKTEGKKSEQLLIDLTNAQQATALNSESILHRMQLVTLPPKSMPLKS